MTTLYVKNMVCDRCIMAVSGILRDMHLHAASVVLGRAEVEETLSEEQTSEFRSRLSALGFELLDDRRRQTIEHIKSIIITLVHGSRACQQVTLSALLADELHQDYSSLSKLFSEVEGKTIERYHIEQRIERVKELIKYDELTLTQIALQMNYSSTAYLSSQFKSVTGMTPSQFKSQRDAIRLSLDKI
jgi:AraC family transcriptional regulator